MKDRSRWMAITAMWLALMGFVLAGYLVWGTQGTATPAKASERAAGAAPADHLDISILTDGQIGHTGYVAFVPSDFTVPANSTVVITVRNFDGNTPIPAQYAAVSGTVGNTETVAPLKAADPNAAVAGKTVNSLNPKYVSHTITIPQLGINVPIAGNSVTTFTIKTKGKGTYTWHCMDPCGDGHGGWGTAMGTKNGYMEGSFTVA